MAALSKTRRSSVEDKHETLFEKTTIYLTLTKDKKQTDLVWIGFTRYE